MRAVQIRILFLDFCHIWNYYDEKGEEEYGRKA